jgi:4-amino-4-deoxy-L-arabinose transferase-like glycosyltransferase
VGVAIVFACVLAVNVWFHLYRLAEVPGWDPEEGYNLDIAWNLAHGRLRLFAFTTAFAEHPPLFYLQLGVFFHLFGYTMTAIRLLAGFYAVLTLLALFFVGRRLIGTSAAFWAMTAYTVAPVMLANTRWGYSYAELAFVGVLCLGVTWQYRETGDRRWLLLAAALAGLATFSDYEGIAWVVFVALVAIVQARKRWRDTGMALAVGLGVPLFGLLTCLVLARGIFLSDLQTTLGRAAGGDPLVQLILLLLNYGQFIATDAWLLLGVVGMFLAPSRARGYLLSAAAVLGVVVLKVRTVGLNLHTAVPLLPLLALGAGIILDLGLRKLYEWFLQWLAVPLDSRPALQRPLAAFAVFLVVVSPVALALVTDAAGLQTSLPTRQDAILGTPGDAEAVSHYIFTHAHGGDLVLASPELAWIFDSPPGPSPRTRGADILQTLAQSGRNASFYPAGLPASRWDYSVSLADARYVVVDNLLRQLAAPSQMPSLRPLLQQAEGWRLVFQQGQYAVYERP